MKHSSISFFLSILLLILGNTTSFAQTAATNQDSLRQFVETWAGVWIQAENYDVWDEEPSYERWVVQIDPTYIVDNQVAILVSEYFKDGMVDVLWFGYQAGNLMYQGATRDGRWLDLSRLDYARLVPTGQRGEETLALELLETEAEHYVYAPLVHMPSESHPGWAWGLQRYFLAFLDGGHYEILTKAGIPTSLDDAFGHANVRYDLAFVDEHASLFPMFEEIGVTSPLNLLMIGAGNPTGELNFYAIEWDPFGIYIYDTDMKIDNDLGLYSFEKRELRCTVLPILPIPPPVVTQ